MTWPKANGEWWQAKIGETRRRDADTTERLGAAGWTVLRVWEHEESDDAGRRIAALVDQVYAHRRGEIPGGSRRLPS